MKSVFKLSQFVVLLLMIAMATACKFSTKKEEVALPIKLRALIVDGENNHGIWPKTTMMMKDYLEQTGLFVVDINRKRFTWQGPHYNKKRLEVETISDLMTKYPLVTDVKTIPVNETKYDSLFNPNFEDYDVVISNLGWKSSDWPDQTKKNFETYMINGGGFVLVHAANNAWGDWDAYNKMIGLGAWGDRNVETGPYVYYDQSGTLQRDPSDGVCASHGPEYEYVLETRAPEHPIMKGLPAAWLHTQDELYDRMRGPAENMTVLATSFSDIENNSPPWNKEVDGTGRHEPLLIAVDYGKGKIFHSALGHMDYSFECVGFITTFQRGAEWAATGKVSQEVPADFPTKEASSARKWK
jgi:hypothetical protein